MSKSENMLSVYRHAQNMERMFNSKSNFDLMNEFREVRKERKMIDYIDAKVREEVKKSIDGLIESKLTLSFDDITFRGKIRWRAVCPCGGFENDRGQIHGKSTPKRLKRVSVRLGALWWVNGKIKDGS